jgi:N6-L-threonylcarbamoyladenine synthase
VLAIESSCDETAAALLDGTRSLQSSVVHTQIPLHARYGGVVPELASRAHVLAIQPVVERALDEASRSLRDLRAIVVTRGPGLGGALLVGVEFAKGLGHALNLPVRGVHHIEGHVLAPLLAVEQGFAPITFPNLTLVVSGGHTSLIRVERPGVYRLLGQTLDDAVGEAFDKASRTMGLGYPGGAVIDHLARSGDPASFALPRPMLGRPGHDFSFSGLKTAFARHWSALGEGATARREDLAAAFQAAVVDVLVGRSLHALRAERLEHLVVTGGVACNSQIRARLQHEGAAHGFRVTIPPAVLCSDNAAMIGAAGYADAFHAIETGCGFDASRLDAQGTWSIERAHEA